MSIDLSLHRIEALVSLFEAYTRPSVHIAGTNGKGSVSALLTSNFRHTGLSVGRFNSPHLLHPSDSISVNGVPITADDFSETIEEVRRKNDEHAINASSFEVLTVCALLVFERSKVDVVLLEVGLGGRLDATNVVPDSCILLSVITAIDLDHQAFLGPTVDAIAREKAGIIRKGKPVVLASQNHESVQRVVNEVCREKSAPLILAPVAEQREWDEHIDGERPPPFSLRPFVPPPPRPVLVDMALIQLRNHDEKDIRSGLDLDKDTKYRVLLPLHGDHQLGNLGAALTVLHALRSLTASKLRNIFVSTFENSSAHKSSGETLAYHRLAEMDGKSISTAVRECVWPGRLSFHLYTSSKKGGNKETLPILVDGAHNEAAARTLSAYVTSILSSVTSSHAYGAESKTKTRVHLTVILALSHSPPKTPESVLVPLLAPFLDSPSGSASNASLKSFGDFHENIDLETRVAFVRFSSPEGMPWVRSVPPSVLDETARNAFPEAKLDTYVTPESDTDQQRDTLADLKDALRWAGEGSSNRRDYQLEGMDRDQKEEGEDFILLAGSLYLVADFYRILQRQ